MGIHLKIPRNHVRAHSLKKREAVIRAEEKGILAKAGLIAHGRGEAFDYLIGETSIPPAIFATKAAVASLILAAHPVISVNGNVAALVPREIVRLSKVLNAPLEVNLFFRTRRREEAIKSVLLKAGAKEVLGVGRDASATIPELFSERRRVDPRGIYSADVVLVPLEDGDRTMALKRLGKFVITIDLNPLSRTAQSADITIVDDIVRAVPNMIEAYKELKDLSREELASLLTRFDNRKNLSEVILYIRDRLKILSEGEHL
ncbi:MAG: phosphopantothenate/pantothenate synthetase [Candidatus Methanomethyliales bacterium]|nr:phosphopantothenate/pantothenate synthetase [Candidatus Methanomethylicales archaeon]